MPRLSDSDRAQRRRHIEDAALELFRERGFHGVGLRDIAAAADVSLGNIYNHYAGKEPIFEALVTRLHADFIDASGPLARFLTTASLDGDVTELGRVMGQMVDEHRDYLTLVYVDIAEFNGVHVRPHYQALAAKFAAVMPAAAGDKLAPWADPSVVLTLLYMQLSSYFVVERLIGARGHLGLDDDQAVRFIGRCFFEGVLPRPNAAPDQEES